ncbi:MAG: hypothetical protein JST00_44190 [Deltaproteobacteria bacterium]|nr:hypothetical protein [Deltaproteobacteria bacterium]
MTRIKPKTVDPRSLRLSPEEGFVLSRVDSALSVKDLVALTGFEEGRIVEIVGNLASQGALEVEGAEATARSVAPRGAELEEEPPIDEPRHDEEPAAEEPTAEEAAEAAANAETDAKDELDERNYRKIYETVFRQMDKDARVAAARDAEGAHLHALCLDPDPQIIHAVLTNPRFGLEHARAVAFHHRTSAGLDMIGKRSELVSDTGVQRRLLRNPQLPDQLLRKIVSPKLIMDIYKIAIDREIPERTRVMTREHLRKKFMLASADERAAFLFKTEGRCLVLLVNCALDAHTTQILCSKNTYTVLFIQNLARWSATPPSVLAHLLKQQLVRRNIGLKKMILKHPNCPAEAKRNL